MKHAKRAQVHRFRDYVALYIGDGETFYLQPKAAKELARLLNKCVRDCDDRDFAASTFASQTLYFCDNFGSV